MEDLEKYKIEYDSIYDYITQGNIIQSKAAWYEKGEKNNKCFLILEKSRKAKNCIQKLLNKEGQEIINSKAIMSDELKDFYEDLYDNKDPIQTLTNCTISLKPYHTKIVKLPAAPLRRSVNQY